MDKKVRLRVVMFPTVVGPTTLILPPLTTMVELGSVQVTSGTTDSPTTTSTVHTRVYSAPAFGIPLGSSTTMTTG